MPRPRFEKLTPEKRENILETAAKEFAANGYDGASFNQIWRKQVSAKEPPIIILIIRRIYISQLLPTTH